VWEIAGGGAVRWETEAARTTLDSRRRQRVAL
jgi:hypothetical protein